ncbi:MAG TPA: tetrahydrofolate dehydrogenase/cyclohydrolase catalytic domain-containing protein [Kiritimatiellia bacterium]|nr:tetrahydrofolate dehydrogenase/cyclohydrolase catalytic domain-containing protein [Kiritimatiellia bacterium]HMO99296.1 tetrahydrofolate dehydrogenase/cyclohydrolase catalytic domain-containing protein [Kiritimatiellia bacterium]HMP95628.1 tetrahydrofolate dehydrogenase/cyclohydrolase catalytic domain-containing protein [Kiritimatiellia bacterium]
MAMILDGKEMSAHMRAEMMDDVRTLVASGVTPGLGVVLVGDNPASRSYVTAKEKACAETGLYSREISLPAGASRAEILDAVAGLNRDPAIHGILVQLPLPDASMEQAVIQAIDPDKDVDGFHPVNVGRMLLGLPAFIPCTPHGVLHMLKRSGNLPAGKHVVVVGRSNIVGRPLVNLLSLKNHLGNATVTMCHTGTPDVGRFTREADIVIAAAGRPGTITADMVREGAVVIDVGVNRVPDPSKKSGFRLVGDVDYDAVASKASAITPVPGGVGPMTITMLLFNTIQSARQALARASEP